MNTPRDKIIQNYIDGYNAFDIEKMIGDLDDKIVFQNIQNGDVTMTLHGLEAFKKQAETAKQYFISRTQKITSVKHTGDKTEIEIDYSAIAAMDFPNDLQKGEELVLKGKSVFTFKNNKIVTLTDIS